MMQDQPRHVEIDREIRQLNQRADHLDHLGNHEQAAELRQEASALAAAEAQRLIALSDAHTQAARFFERLRDAWEIIEPGDSLAWFIEHNDDPEVVELRIALRRQKARILILEAARA